MQEDHENLTELAVAEYQKRALGDMMTKYREKLEERMNEEYIKLCRKNDEVSEKKCSIYFVEFEVLCVWSNSR